MDATWFDTLWRVNKSYINIILICQRAAEKLIFWRNLKRGTAIDGNQTSPGHNKKTMQRHESGKDE